MIGLMAATVPLRTNQCAEVFAIHPFSKSQANFDHAIGLRSPRHLDAIEYVRLNE